MYVCIFNCFILFSYTFAIIIIHTDPCSNLSVPNSTCTSCETLSGSAVNVTCHEGFYVNGAHGDGSTTYSAQCTRGSWSQVSPCTGNFNNDYSIILFIVTFNINY